MNRHAFSVFLEKQQVDEVLGKAAAVAARSMTKGKAGAKLGAAYSPGGLTRAMARKRELAKAQAPELKAKIQTLKGKAAGDPAKMAALRKSIDTTKKQITNPAKVSGPRGDLRRSRLAQAEKLRSQGGKGNLLDRAKSAIGKLDTPQNRERLKAAGKAGVEYFRTGGISGRFNQDHAERGSGSGTNYQSQLGALSGGASRQVRQARERSAQQSPENGGSPLNDLRGLQPSEKQDVTGSAGPVQKRTVKITQQAIPRETKGPKGTSAVS